MAYFTQQLINAITLGAIYGLIAIGYTMVYGIIGIINFAHGEVFMIGAFISLIGFMICGLAGISSVPVGLGRRACRAPRAPSQADGIVEAQNSSGDLFGFDRINQLLEENTSAQGIADAAQAFGQEDDILVLQVRRNTA